MAHPLAALLVAATSIILISGLQAVQGISEEQFYERDLAQKAARLSARPPPRFIRYDDRELPVAPSAREVTEPEVERVDVTIDDDLLPAVAAEVRSGEPLSLVPVTPQVVAASLPKSDQSNPIMAASDPDSSGYKGRKFVPAPPYNFAWGYGDYLNLRELRVATAECINQLVRDIVEEGIDNLPAEGLKFNPACCRLLGCIYGQPWNGLKPLELPTSAPVYPGYGHGPGSFPWPKLSRLLESLTTTTTTTTTSKPSTTAAQTTTTTTTKPTTTTSGAPPTTKRPSARRSTQAPENYGFRK